MIQIFTPSQLGLVALVGLLAILTFAGCSSTPEISPREQVLRSGQRTVSQGVTRGFAAAENLDVYTLRARYNAAGCDAPEFEIYGHQRWSRVFLDGSAEIVGELELFKQRSTGMDRLQFLEVEGKFSGRRRADSGVRYQVFVVSAVR